MGVRAAGAAPDGPNSTKLVHVRCIEFQLQRRTAFVNCYLRLRNGTLDDNVRRRSTLRIVFKFVEDLYRGAKPLSHARRSSWISIINGVPSSRTRRRIKRFANVTHYSVSAPAANELYDSNVH
jgi:hypothetical protein